MDKIGESDYLTFNKLIKKIFIKFCNYLKSNLPILVLKFANINFLDRYITHLFGVQIISDLPVKNLQMPTICAENVIIRNLFISKILPIEIPITPSNPEIINIICSTKI